MARTPKLFSRSSGKRGDKYLSQLEELLRLNRGGFNTFAEDTGLEGGYIVPGGVPIRNNYMTSMGLDFTSPMVGRPEYQSAPQRSQGQTQDGYGYFNQQMPQQVGSSTGEIAYQPQQTSEQLQQQYEQSGTIYGIASMADGGILYNDGTIRYQDGTIREGDGSAQPIATNADGTIQYSDGSTRRMQTSDEIGEMTRQTQPIMNIAGDRQRILYDDGSIRYGDYNLGDVPMPQFGEGMGALGQFIFDNPQQTVTQDYGNFNPGMGYYGNRHAGIDYRVRDLRGANRYGVGAPASVGLNSKVFATGYDPAYGNYVVLDMNGHKLQFSHLDAIDVQPGQEIPADTVFGAYGTSGNSTAAHLDLQYFPPEVEFNPNMNFTSQIRWGTDAAPQNPLDFAKNVLENPAAVANLVPGATAPDGQPAPGEVVKNLTPALAQLVQSTQQRTEQRTGQKVDVARAEVAPPEYKPIMQRAAETTKAAANIATKPAQTAGKILGSTIEAVQPTGETDLGITEGLITPEAASTRFESARKEMQKRGDAPRGVFGKLRQAVGDTTEAIGETLNLPETGFSEAIAGGATKKTDLKNLFSNRAFASTGEQSSVEPKSQAISSQEQSLQSQPLQSVETKGQEPQVEFKQLQPGGGVSKTFEGVANMLGGLFSRKQPADMAPDRAVGSTAAVGNELPMSRMADQSTGGEVRDTSDPFFKTGAFQAIKDATIFQDDSEIKDQALTLDIFKPEFFQDASKVGALSGTPIFSAAQDRYVANEQRKLEEAARRQAENAKRKPGEGYAEYMKRTGGQSTLDSLRSQGATVGDTVTFSPYQTQRMKDEVAAKYAKRDGESTVEWMKRTGQQSTLDQYGGADNFQSIINSLPRNSTIKQVNTSRGGMSLPGGAQRGGMSSYRLEWTAPKLTGGMSMPDGTQKGGMSSVQGGVIAKPSFSKPKQNLFSKAGDYMKNVFRRFF